MLIPYLLLLLVALALLGGCSRGGNGYSENMKQMEKGGYKDQELSAKQIEEIQAGIRKYRKEVERKAQATEQLGIYYKMLAVKYMDGQMYQAAYDALKEALAIYPENPILFYYSAVCAARLGKAQVESAERSAWLERSEKHYRRAIALDPLYVDALYGLSVLHIFELSRPAQAEEPLRRILSKEKKNADAMFLLANVYYQTGRLEEALELYTRIAGLAIPEQKRGEALADKARVEEELYGPR